MNLPQSGIPQFVRDTRKLYFKNGSDVFSRLVAKSLDQSLALNGVASRIVLNLSQADMGRRQLYLRPTGNEWVATALWTRRKGASAAFIKYVECGALERSAV